jgi:hypothetical protein
MSKQQWIQKALKKHKRGALHRQLGISERDKIPVTLLKRIKNAKIGDTIKNPTSKGKQSIKVTTLLKKRAVLALTLKKIRR